MFLWLKTLAVALIAAGTALLYFTLSPLERTFALKLVQRQVMFALAKPI